MKKSRPQRYLAKLSNTNTDFIKNAIKEKQIIFEELIKSENLTQRLEEIINQSILYSCTYNNSKILNEIKKYLDNNTDKLNKIALDSSMFLHSAIHNKSYEALNFLLNNNLYKEEQIKNSCVIAVKFNNKKALEQLYYYGKERFNDFNLNFNNKVCMRLAINNRDLEIIDCLYQQGVSPFNNNSSKHLLDIIKRDDQEWLDFYLKNNIIGIEHIMSKNGNLLHKLMLFNMNNMEKYKKGFFYAQKIMDYFINKEDNVKELVTIFKSIPIYFPASEGKIIEFKDNLKAAILYKHINAKIIDKSQSNIKRNKI